MNKNIYMSIAILALLGVVLDIVNNMIGPEGSFWYGLSMTKYFTIQSNAIVSIYFFMKYFEQKEQFLHDMFGGVLIYITTTFFVFAIFLQPIYHPEGLGFVANIIVHYLVPISVIAYFVTTLHRYQYTNNHVKMWITYPLVYLAFMIIHGITTGDYLYPFFQVESVGILGLVLACIGLFLFFLGLSFIVVKIVSLKKSANN